MPLLALAALLLPALAQDTPPPLLAGDVLVADVDWQATGEESARLLSGFLQVDTVNPDGNETRGAVYLAAWLAREGIASEILEYAPGRGSLVARLPAHPEHRAGPPICLLSHLDVAEFEADRWSEGRGPLSGTIDEQGMIWGRGALDMKGLTVMQAMAMATVARAGIPLQRDLVLLSVADEEVSNDGMAFIAEQHWGDIGCSHVVNEGGMGITDMFFEGQGVYTISVGEKGALWGRVVATGEPGHGSVPRDGQSIDRLLDAIDAIETRRVRPQFHESLYEVLGNAGAHQGGLSGAILQKPALVRGLLKGTFLENPVTRAVVLDTANITGLGGAMQPNVVPGEAWANLDARLLPGTDPDAFLADLHAVIDDPAVRIEVDSFVGSNVSEWRGDPLYEALERRAVGGRPDVVAGPVLSVGYTDSAVLRELGVRAYGFMPVMVDAEQLATMHGDDERVSVAQMASGTEILTRALLDVVGAPGGAPPVVQPVAWPPMTWPAPAWAQHTPMQPTIPLPPRFARLGGPVQPAPAPVGAPLLAPDPAPVWGTTAPEPTPQPTPRPPPEWGG